MDKQLLTEFFQINTVPISIILYMSVMIILNRNFEPEVTKRFRVPILLLFSLVICDNVDYYFMKTFNSTIFHVITHNVGYSIRLIILATMGSLAIRNEQIKYKNIIYLPAIITIIVCFIGLFVPIVCSYNEDGTIHRGFLAYLPHLMAAVYLIVYIIRGLKLFKIGKIEEGWMVLLGSSLTSICTIIEMVFSIKGMLIGSIALIIIFYYLHIHNEHFKIDILTGAFNRLSFRADVDKYVGHIKGFLILDLNNLKYLNDNFGHDKGDEAIKTLAYTVINNIPKYSFLYRTGGDEFTIICTDEVKVSLETIKQNIKNHMQSTKYSCAIGYSAFNDPFEEINVVLKRADKEMYKDKAIMKGYNKNEIV